MAGRQTIKVNYSSSDCVKASSSESQSVCLHIIQLTPYDKSKGGKYAVTVESDK